MPKSVLVDTSFLIRLLNSEDPLHNRALGYYRYFLSEDIKMRMSSIAVAEYCVRGSWEDLPVQNLLFVPFNIDHAKRAGELMSLVYEAKQQRGAIVSPRAVIPNDTKMFAQADLLPDIEYFCSSDSEAYKVYELLKSKTEVHFQYLDIREHSHLEYFGILDFE